MFVHPQFDPVAFSVGPLSIRWYGLAYLVGFALFWLLGRYRARQAWRGISIESVEDLLFYGMLGVIVGGRLGFCFFYQPQWRLSYSVARRDECSRRHARCDCGDGLLFGQNKDILFTGGRFCGSLGAARSIFRSHRKLY